MHNPQIKLIPFVDSYLDALFKIEIENNNPDFVNFDLESMVEKLIVDYGEEYFLQKSLFVRKLSALKNFSKVICLNMHPVGYVISYPKSKTTYFLDQITISPKYHGFGIGSRIIWSVIYIAQNRNYNQVNLWVDSEESSLLDFYKKFGFEITNSDKKYIYLRKTI